jgi:tRNA(Ile)-lysidine synthase
MLNAEALEALKGGKNLLAFSGGSDSSALFFLLNDAEIDFDIALVNYHTRPQSDAEAAYARELAERYGKTCHLGDARLEDANFEHQARKFRYAFFESLIRQHGYENLITAHQLDDRLEWMLMQLCKGAGVIEMAGMRNVETCETYRLVRPLLETTRAELKEYLQRHGHRWFEDESNTDERFKRNAFRRRFAAPMLEQYAQGVKKSFAYLEEDLRSLEEEVAVDRAGELFWFRNPAGRRALLRAVDRTLKKAGFLMRRGDRERLKEEDVVVVGRRYVVAIGADYTFIAPYEKATLKKPFKEACRKLGVAPKLRPYLSRVRPAYERVALLLGGGGVDPHRKG